jgi:hypothetical protein
MLDEVDVFFLMAQLGEVSEFKIALLPLLRED